MKKISIFCIFLEYISAIWYILWPFGNLLADWYIFPDFGILNKERSCNPGRSKRIYRRPSGGV
jgi:hypothetical protein